MSERGREPRQAIWAVAEVSWQDQGGAVCVAAGTLEDTSQSGACVRVKAPILVGSRVMVKWHREQFSAVAKNCRSDGREFLLGVRRELAGSAEPVIASRPAEIKPKVPVVAAAKAQGASMEAGKRGEAVAVSEPASKAASKSNLEPASKRAVVAVAVAIPAAAQSKDARSNLRDQQAQRISADQERKGMEAKGIFPKFWRREPGKTESREEARPAEAAVSKAQARPAEALTGPKGELLSYEDIYRAAGILRPRSGCEIGKVVEMLHCERMRGLPEEVKRASVLMAIEAGGALPDDLLKDATERQRALEQYEAGQRKQLEDFEARKAQESAQLEAEMARVTAHYAERIKANQDQVAAEKEALRSWQMLKQNESQRISEVIELCGKPATRPHGEAFGATAGTGMVRGTAGPSLLPGVMNGQAN